MEAEAKSLSEMVTSTPTSRVLVSSCLVLALTSVAAPASAAGTAGVAIGTITRSGSVLTVRGSATFADQVFVMQSNDPAGDTQLPATLGQDLTGVSIATTATGSISFRWVAADLPPVLNGTPTTVYGWTFCIGPPRADEGDEEPVQCWEITASRMNWLIPNPEPWLQVWRCGSTCDSNELTNIQGTLVFDGATKTITATLPLAALGAEAGQEVSPLIGFSFHDGAVWTAMVGWYLVEEDFLDFDTRYGIPGREVALAVGPRGQDPTGLTYDAAATLGANGSYTGALDISTLAPGDYAVFARACFGAGNCAYATSDVTI